MESSFSQVTQMRIVKNRADFLYIYTTLIIVENMQLITADTLNINSAQAKPLFISPKLNQPFCNIAFVMNKFLSFIKKFDRNKGNLIVCS